MIDYNGHLNVGYFGVLFEEAARGLFSRIDLSSDYRSRSDHALFAKESHFVFLKEVFPNEVLSIYAQILGVTNRALHCMYHMRNDSRAEWAARQEILYLHLDLKHQKVVEMPQAQLQRLKELQSRHDSLPQLDVGRRIEMRLGTSKG
jgi:acyl-CoA thioester hydrolase